MLSLLPWLLLLLPLTLDSVTHWVMQDDTLFTKDRSEFDLADSGSLVKLLNQEKLVEEASRILDDMTIVKQHIMNETPPISDDGNECDTQTQCYNSGSLADYDFSIVPAILKTVDGYSRFQQYMCESSIPSLVPNCTSHSQPPVNMASYHHIPGIDYIVEEKGSPSYNLLSFIPTDNLALFGHCLNKNMKMNATNWHVYYAATFYWRLQGNHVAARDCVLKSLYYANNERGIVDGPLVTLANLLSSAGFDGDAAQVMQHTALNPTSVQLKLWSAGNLYTLSGQYKLALEMYNSTLQLGPFPLADERLQTMQCYNKVILRMEKQNNLLRSTLKRLQEHHVLESRYIGVQEQLVRRLRNPVLPQHIINQIKSTEEAVFNTQQLVNDQKNIQASLNPFSSVSPLKSRDELEIEVTVSGEEFKESQQSKLEYIEVQSDKPTSLQWMRAARIRLEEVTSTIGEQLDHHPDNLHIHMFDEPPEDGISVKGRVITPDSVPALEPSTLITPDSVPALEPSTLEQPTNKLHVTTKPVETKPKLHVTTKPVETKPIKTKPVPMEIPASPQTTVDISKVEHKVSPPTNKMEVKKKLEEHKQTTDAAKPKKAEPNGICNAEEGTGEGCMISVSDNSINTCGIGVKPTKEVEQLEVKTENGSMEKKAKQPAPGEGEEMFELYEDKAQWDSMQGDVIIEDESIVVEPTEWKIKESSLRNPTVEEILKEPDVIEKMRVMRNDYMKSGVMMSNVKEGREDEKDVPVYATVNNCKGCPNPKDKETPPPAKIKIKLTYDDDYTLLLTQVPMDQAVDILKIEKCAEYVPIFTLQEPYFPLMIPLITFGIHVEDVLKLKTMPVQLPLTTPNCTASMELGVCETCYDHLFKDRVLFGTRKLQEHFAFQEINQPHIANNVEYLGAMLAHRLTQEPDNWMLYHLSALYHRSTAITIGPALECTRRALALAPLQYRTIPLITLVNVLHQAQRYPDAMTVLIELVQLDPTQFIIHIEASMLHAAISEPNAALYFGMEAVRLEPYSPLTNQLFNSLLCYFKIDQKMSRARSGNKDVEVNMMKKKKDAPLPGHKTSSSKQKDLSGIEVWRIEHFEGGDVNMTWVDEPNPI